MGRTTPFRIQIPELRHHAYVIGKTGSGKTTLLRNLILQHIALGHGVGLIDPHGDLADDLLENIPPSRADDLIYFNPSDLEFPVSMNLLANVRPDGRHLVASGIVGAFKSIWHDSWGPRMNIFFTMPSRRSWTVQTLPCWRQSTVERRCLSGLGNSADRRPIRPRILGTGIRQLRTPDSNGRRLLRFKTSSVNSC